MRSASNWRINNEAIPELDAMFNSISRYRAAQAVRASVFSG
jgi:hypothetical protein